jgi:hypothetical protein
VPARSFETVPVAVVEIVPALVVEMVPALVVEIVPAFAKAILEIARTNIAAQRVGLRFFIFAPGDITSGVRWSAQ